MDKDNELKAYEKLAALFGTTPEELYKKANNQSEHQELSEDLTEALSRLSPKERDVLTLRFGLRDGRKRTLEEVGNLFGVSTNRIRQIEVKALCKLRKFSESKKNTILKTGDIIKVSLKMTPQIPEEDEDKSEINLDDYPTNCSISYDYPDSGFTDLSFTEDAGCSSFSDIKDYLEQYLTDDIKEIDEYKIFEVDNVGEYQTAKIKVKSLKEL